MVRDTFFDRWPQYYKTDIQAVRNALRSLNDDIYRQIQPQFLRPFVHNFVEVATLSEGTTNETCATSFDLNAFEAVFGFIDQAEFATDSLINANAKHFLAHRLVAEYLQTKRSQEMDEAAKRLLMFIVEHYDPLMEDTAGAFSAFLIRLQQNAVLDELEIEAKDRIVDFWGNIKVDTPHFMAQFAEEVRKYNLPPVELAKCIQDGFDPTEWHTSEIIDYLKKHDACMVPPVFDVFRGWVKRQMQLAEEEAQKTRHTMRVTYYPTLNPYYLMKCFTEVPNPLPFAEMARQLLEDMIGFGSDSIDENVFLSATKFLVRLDEVNQLAPLTPKLRWNISGTFGYAIKRRPHRASGRYLHGTMEMLDTPKLQQMLNKLLGEDQPDADVSIPPKKRLRSE